MNLENLAENLKSTSSPALTDLHLFDPKRYSARMSKYVNQETAAGQVFFDALQFANDLHSGQLRKSGAPYITHPCAVAEILARELKLDDPLVLAAALLHDVVEDVPSIQLGHIRDRFGNIVAELVDGCTKLSRNHLDYAALKDMTHSKIFLSASRQLAVLIIKLADRLHNLRTLHYLPKSKRQRIAQETIEVYAPIAAKLNIFPLKRELYHLALSYIYPRKSKKILQFNRSFRNSPEVADFDSKLRAAFAAAGLTVTVRPRAKGLGTYYNPLKRTLDLANTENHMDFAVILTSENILHCYWALGIVNSTFPPIPRTLRDFIANPKTNGYRSLHVRIHVGGNNYLIKFRTPQIDQYATYGILNRSNVQQPLSDEHWHEVSELLRSIGEYGGAARQRKALIRFSETEEIFVYSPQGDIYYLPRGSVVLDFAYMIHSELGERCEGALINNQWVPPTHPLHDGETVRILTSSEQLDVDPDLEELCRTPRARTSINKHLQHKRRRYAEAIGRQLVLQEIQRCGLTPDILEGEGTRLILEVHNIRDLAELFARVGQDLLSPQLVAYYFSGSPAHGPEQQQAQHCRSGSERNVLVVDELDKAIHKFARCCNPFPGQEHVVATLSERGITFHQEACADLLYRHDLQPQKLLDVIWNEESRWPHPLTFHLQVLQETLTSLIPALLHLDRTTDLQQMQSATDKHGQPQVKLAVTFADFKQARSFYRHLPANRTHVESYERQGRPHTSQGTTEF